MVQNSTQPTTERSSGVIKTLRKYLVPALAILLLVVAILPRVAASWMREDIQASLSEETQLDVSIGSLSTGWFSGVHVSDLKISVPSGQEVLSVDSIKTHKSLLGLITRDKEVGDIDIDSPSITVAVGDGVLKELKAAFDQMDPTQGMLKVIADPEREALVNFHLRNGDVSLLTSGSELQSVSDKLNADVTLDREAEDVQIDAFLETPLTLSPSMGDFGLQFIAPVLAKALKMDGDASLTINHCHVDPSNFPALDLDGELAIHTVNAEVNGPVISRITDAIGQLSAEDGQAAQSPVLELQVTSDSVVAFSVADGVVHHEGFAFGMPKVLPSLVLTTSGDVTFDKTLDLQVKASIPFERMGESVMLQKLGSPSFSVPVTGTFEEPKVDVGEGKVLGRFVQELVLNATDNEIDAGPLLKKLAESGLLSKLGKRDEEEPNSDSESDAGPGLLKRFGGLLNRKSDGADDDATEPTERGGLLKRLRQRRQGVGPVPPASE